MKATKIISVLSLILLVAALNTGHAQSLSSTTYKVRIQNMLDPLGYAGKYAIGIVNDRGTLVAPVQAFRFGTWDYIFRENVLPLGNSRTARMDNVSGPNANTITYVVDPVTITGPFKQGMTYYFVLTPRKP